MASIFTVARVFAIIFASFISGECAIAAPRPDFKHDGDKWLSDQGPADDRKRDLSLVRLRRHYGPDGQGGWYESVEKLSESVKEQAKTVLPENVAEHITIHLLLTPVLLGFAMMVLIAVSMCDWKGDPDSTVEAKPKQKSWSISGILALTSYRFYTGFLSATWMPYLLAMEGAELTSERQSVFMGSAKLIYGLSILMNPMFGLVGDQVAVVSRWSGRRLFVLAGVAVGGLGIYGCLVAAEIRSIRWYMIATVLWMLGEAMADVTTETLVPELLPRTQYQISSAIRALNFLIGGLVGYAALIFFRQLHYSWLYFAYLVVMLVTALLTLCSIQTQDLKTPGLQQQHPIASLSFSDIITRAYCLPASLKGGFPRACLCLFVFSLGSAPMFFLLLMVRDIIGIKDQEPMQFHFGVISMVFFIMAALASVLGTGSSEGDAAAGGGGGGGDARRGSGGVSLASSSSSSDESGREPPEAGAGGVHAGRSASERLVVEQRWKYMVASTIFFASVCSAIPLAGLMPTLTGRTVAFYIIGALFGLAFGAVYARFQECTWSLLPPGVDIANAMGFAAMCKLAGVGIGNFLAGLILDRHAVSTDDTYRLSGYFIMCQFCAIAVFISGYLAHTVGNIAMSKERLGRSV